MQNFGYYGVMIWLPNYLVDPVRLRPDAVGGVDRGDHRWAWRVGIFAFGQIADRIGRRPAFLGYMLGAAVMVVVYSRLTDPTALLIGGAVMGFFVNGMLGGYGALMSELYPTVGARHGAERAVQYRPRHRRIRPGGRRRDRGAPTASRPRSPCWRVIYVLDMLAMWLLIPERRGAAADVMLAGSLPTQPAAGEDRPEPAAPAEQARQGRRAIPLVNAEYRHLRVAARSPATEAAPGQFFQLLCPHPAGEQPFLRRPMSVYGADPRRAQVAFLYKVTGAGTRGLATLQAGRHARHHGAARPRLHARSGVAVDRGGRARRRAWRRWGRWRKAAQARRHRGHGDASARAGRTWWCPMRSVPGVTAPTSSR